MNKNQELFIEYIVTNLLMLNEAYSKADVERLTKKFKDQADAFNIKGKGGTNLTEDEIKAIIDSFDKLRNTTNKSDINKWDIKELVKFVSDNLDIPDDEDEVDQTPDVVYNDDNYVIWNGSKEGNCIRYGTGERWCITKGSFSSYRYDSSKGYPTFYLVKNKNLSQDNALSFVAIQVRNKQENERYVYTNRKNSPYESQSMSWEELNNEIPWLRNIPNAKELIKYIGIGKAEEKQKAWTSYTGLTEEEFDALSFSDKKIYVSIRKDKSYFLNIINHDKFIKNNLKDYPRLQEWIASFPFEFSFRSVIRYLNIFTPAQQQSIAIKVNNIDHGGNDLSYDSISDYPYENIIKLFEYNPKLFPNNSKVNIALVKANGKSYLTNIDYSNNNVDLTYFNSKTWVSLKLNAASEDLFFDHPSIVQLPFNVIIKILKDNNLSPKKVKYLLYKIEKGEGGFDSGGFNIQTIGDKKILFDVNTVIPTAYDLTGGEANKVDLTFPENADIEEEFKKIISGDENFLVKIGSNIMKDLNITKSFTLEEINNIFKNAPQNVWEQIANSSQNLGDIKFLNITPDKLIVYTNNGRSNKHSGTDLNNFNSLQTDEVEDFIETINKANYKYSDEGIVTLLERLRYYSSVQRAIISNPNFPVAAENTYTYVVIDDKIYRYQTTDITNSNRWSESRASWVRGVVRLPNANQQALAGRGRPAGTPNQAAAANTPAAAGTINISDAFTEAGLGTGYSSLPLSTRRRLLTLASNVQMGGDRGTTARQNQLGQNGTVNNVLSVNTGSPQPSKIYFINMANNSRIASINVQPGNINYIVTTDGHYVIDSPRQLLQALQQRNLAEGMKSYIVKNYLTLNPHQIDEVKTMLRTYISNKKK
jgi:hypothetical protein